MVPVTLQPMNADFMLADWRATGLNVPSGIKSQVATIEDSLVRKVIGKLGAADAAMLDQHLRTWSCL